MRSMLRFYKENDMITTVICCCCRQRVTLDSVFSPLGALKIFDNGSLQV